MQYFSYCPPSNNLWTVQIKEHSYGTSADANNKKSLVSLYSNIISVNNSWRNYQFNTGWKTDVSKLNSEIPSYLSGFEGGNYCFLASQVNLTPFEMGVNSSIGQELLEHGGFITMGNVASNKGQGKTCNISFLVSNWSFTDIVIEPWIAAMMQRGLLEYSDGLLNNGQSIKADIFIREYSASTTRS